MPAPALNVATSAAFWKELWAASATIDTDQKLKNHRFHMTAMKAKLSSSTLRFREMAPSRAPRLAKIAPISTNARTHSRTATPQLARSEERRVGKEGRYRWSPAHSK